MVKLITGLLVLAAVQAAEPDLGFGRRGPDQIEAVSRARVLLQWTLSDLRRQIADDKARRAQEAGRGS